MKQRQFGDYCHEPGGIEMKRIMTAAVVCALFWPALFTELSELAQEEIISRMEYDA